MQKHLLLKAFFNESIRKEAATALDIIKNSIQSNSHFFIIRTGDVRFLINKETAQLSYALKTSDNHQPLNDIYQSKHELTVEQVDYSHMHVEFHSQREKDAAFLLKIDKEDILLQLSRNKQSVDIMIIYSHKISPAGSFATFPNTLRTK
jgi:hypothetical protein